MENVGYLDVKSLVNSKTPLDGMMLSQRVKVGSVDRFKTYKRIEETTDVVFKMGNYYDVDSVVKCDVKICF